MYLFISLEIGALCFRLRIDTPDLRTDHNFVRSAFFDAWLFDLLKYFRTVVAERITVFYGEIATVLGCAPF